MTNREKVIKGLEICTSKPCYCTDCPYKKECCLDSQNVMEDALAILKEQNVIQCCDCRWWDKDKYECKNDDILRLIKDCGCGSTFKTEPDWFCADGDRR